MELTTKQTRFLRGLAHPLSPAVQMGKASYTAAFAKEVGRHLADHELIKVRLNTDEREEFLEAADQLVEATGASLIQTIGRIVVLYKQAKKPLIQLPDAPKIPVTQPRAKAKSKFKRLSGVASRARRESAIEARPASKKKRGGAKKKMGGKRAPR